MAKKPPARRPARPAATTTRKPAARGAAPSSSKRFPIALVIGAVVAAGLVTVIVLTMGSGSPTDEETCVALRVEEGMAGEEAERVCATLEVGAVQIEGEALPRYPEAGADNGVGQLIPEVAGAGFDGIPVAISRDGRAKVLVFFAHWCEFCRQEVPAITAWLPTADIPENVDLISVITGVSITAVNYPSSAWLEREGWTIPVILDDAAGSAAAAYGLSAFPYFVFVDAEGRVVWRHTGLLPVETIAALIDQIAGA